MNRERSLRGVIVYISLAVLILVGFFLSVGIGNVHIGFAEVLRAITGGACDEKTRAIIMDIRLPRVIMTVILGGGLATSGLTPKTKESSSVILSSLSRTSEAVNL